METKTLVALLCFLLNSISMFALDFEAAYRQGVDLEAANILTERLRVSLIHSGRVFDFSAAMSIGNEDHFSSGFQEVFFGPFSVDLIEGGMGLRLEDFRAKAGIYPHFDIVDSPYSLFVNGRGLSAPILDIAFADARFQFSDRWIGLNAFSAFGWPDRGAVQKNYALVLGKLRLGFQDLAVFSTQEDDSSRYFDIDYFISPLPSYFVQYVSSSLARPWGQYTNDNSVMGFFGDYSEEGWYAYAQILIDDLNMNRFLDPEGDQNPDKIAWSLGGSYDSAYGRFSLYHAGATAYTFEAFGSSVVNEMYGYSYYPADSFTSGSSVIPIETEDNMAGYTHGENNIAFLAGWEKKVWLLDCSAQAEFTLSGSKAAGNPWHELVNWYDGGQGTRMLDDPVLEKKLLISGSATYSWKDFIFGFDFSLGGAWNRLALRAVESANTHNLEMFYSPSAENAFLCKLGLSGSWKPAIRQ
jgi:hypothetical protein